MDPPAEQLIRDYLNRMSLVARSQLGPGDRQALLDRMRAQIEAECGGPRAASLARVRKALASLGDPIAVVELEHARVAANRRAAAANGARGVSNVSAAKGAPAAGSTGGLAAAGANGANGASAAGSANGASHQVGSVVVRPRSGEAVGGQPKAGNEAPADAARTASTRLRHGRQIAAEALLLARRNKLEVAGVVLIAVGGALFPPLWLLGAVVALISRGWDARDKLIGLGGAIWLVIFGTVLTLVAGGAHGTITSYVHEAWLGASRLSRAGSVLGGGYLLWRLRSGRRERKQPPFKVPRRSA